MTVPCFQYWRLRVTENYGGDTVKIDSISFLGRSGGNHISIDGEAISNAGDASGAFSGGGAIGYKFALPVTPTHIDITASGTSRPKTGVIEYSADGRTWYPLQTLGFD